jgi:hypothetical protein
MCVIVDANVAGHFFSDPYHGDYAPVVRWINNKNGKLVYGGKLQEELYRHDKAKRLLLAWRRAGRAREFSLEQLSAAEAGVVSTKACQSNDVHIIALARCSGARLLCTEDRTLMADFQNRKLLAKPRGKIYRNPEHAPLLKHVKSCGIKIPTRKPR